MGNLGATARSADGECLKAHQDCGLHYHSKGTITQHACQVLVSLPSAALSRPSGAAALGFGGLHCINETGHKYKSRRGKNSAGAEKWLDLNFWPNTTDCLQHAKNAGYQVTPGVLLCSTLFPETSASKLFGRQAGYQAYCDKQPGRHSQCA